MKHQPQFDTDEEYDRWFEMKDRMKILDNYFGEEVIENGQGD